MVKGRVVYYCDLCRKYYTKEAGNMLVEINGKEVENAYRTV